MSSFSMASILDSSSLFRGMERKKPGHRAAAERMESTMLLTWGQTREVKGKTEVKGQSLGFKISDSPGHCLAARQNHTFLFLKRVGRCVDKDHRLPAQPNLYIDIKFKEHSWYHMILTWHNRYHMLLTWPTTMCSNSVYLMPSSRQNSPSIPSAQRNTSKTNILYQLLPPRTTLVKCLWTLVKVA